MEQSVGRRRVAVIMAGGSGERFWPLSRRERPKQLLRLARPDKTLLEEAVERIAPLVPPERVFIATGRTLQQAIRAAGLVPDENVLAEPCKRNTAGCLVYAAAQLTARFGEADGLTMAVLTADHMIGAPDEFRRAAETAMEAAEREDALVTIGIRPARPETGYGYIEIAEGASPLDLGREEPKVFPVARFREKPCLEDAERYVESGRFFWNSGMFFWKVSSFLAEFERAKPAFAQAAADMAEALAQGDEAGADKVFEALEDISIDYALMEKAGRVFVVRAGFPWDDVGAWDALDRAMPRDESGNVLQGDPVAIGTKDCIIYNAEGAEKLALGVVGCEGLVVVACGDAVLVAPKERAQEVKQIVAALKERGAGQV